MPLVVQIVSTRDKEGITETRGTKVTREVVEVSRGEDTTPMRTKTRVVDPVAGVIGTTVGVPGSPDPGTSFGTYVLVDVCQCGA